VRFSAARTFGSVGSVTMPSMMSAISSPSGSGRPVDGLHP
jgi:hypothetical protein